MKRLLYILAVTSLSMTGCKKEAKLTPTTKPEDIYGDPTLPQGNHPYDAEILQLYKDYRTLFLYKYKPHDLYYNITDNLSGYYDTATDKTVRGGYFDVPADEAYVGQQLDLLKELWLNYYPDSLLRKGLPQKVFLVDSFYFAYPGPGKPVDNWPEMFNAFDGGDYILAGFGGSRIAAITPEDKYAMKGELNAAFLVFTHKQGAIKPIAAFKAQTDYGSVNPTNYHDEGLLEYDYNGGNTLDRDWDAYTRIIVSNSYDVLTAPGNILSPDVDTKGVIRKKYDIMIAYFKTTFGVDLQAIGNAGI